MNQKPRRDTRLDTVVLVLLIALLLGGAFLIGRRAKPEEPMNESIVRPRVVPKDLIKFHEVDPITVDGKRLRGLAVGPDDRIYVLAHFKILVYEANGTFVRDYELDRAPHCAAFAPDGRLYLGLGSRLGVFDLESGKLTEWPDLGERSLVGSVAIGDRTLMAGDSGTRTMWVYTLDGEQLARISNGDAPEGEGDAPSVHFDVTAAGDGTFWATDAGRHAVIHYSPTGHVIERWGEQGEEIGKFGGCCNPAHLATFPDGRLLIVEKKPDLVKVCLPDGHLDSVVAPPTAFVMKTFLADGAVDSKGRVLVLDPKMSQVRVFVAGAPK